jgi:hypothetical protein
LACCVGIPGEVGCSAAAETRDVKIPDNLSGRPPITREGEELACALITGDLPKAKRLGAMYDKGPKSWPSTEQNPSVSAGRTGLNAYFNWAQGMGLRAEQNQKILGISESAERQYRAENGDVVLARDTVERISLILNLWLDLCAIFRTEEDAQRWLKSPNSAFGGNTPLERMLGGNISDLVYVRHSVESAIDLP